MNAVELQGTVSAGFELVADEFVRNFELRGDIAASCAVYLNGEMIVDVWAGATNEGPWQPDTRTTVWSVSKAVTTVCLLMAAERGLLQLDMPVATLWPEFAATGKHDLTVRQALAHRAGLVAPDRDFTIAEVAAWNPVIEVLAAQQPAWKAGSAYMYHPFTFGFLAGEILRRASGRTLNQWLEQFIAGPLAVKMSFGADPTSPDVHHLLEPIPPQSAEAAQMMATVLTQPLIDRSMSFGGAFDTQNLFESMDRPEAMLCELGGVNLIATARGLARLFAATIGSVDGVRLLNQQSITDACTVCSEGPDFLGMDVGNRWGAGFLLACSHRPMTGPGSFGHDGAGGALVIANPEQQVSFAYQPARPSKGPDDDRANALARALRACL